MTKIIILILCALCATTGRSWAQDPLPSMPSPTASNLGLYGEIPVSEFTGTPNISIPLYEFKSKSFTIPVTLSYHTSGIRPELHPGPTGLGWTLLAGGAITREVRNIQDENDSKVNDGTVGFGYLCNKNGWLAQSDWKPLSLTSSEVYNRYFDSEVPELEADEFSFNFFGISGKFYFDQTGSIRVQSDRPLSISFDPGNYLPMSELDFDNEGSVRRSIREFVITDERGNQYYFGGKDAVEISDPISYGHERVSPKDKMGVTSWFITKAKAANSLDSITFEYERGPFISQLYKWNRSSLSMGSTGFDTDHVDWASMSGYRINGSFISPVYLSAIKSSDGTVLSLFYSESTELEYSDQMYYSIFEQDGQHRPEIPFPWLLQTSQIPRLASITPPIPGSYVNPLNHIRWLKCDVVAIRSQSGSQVKTIEFHYNNNASERLFLDSLTIKGETQGKDDPHGSSVPSLRYAFTYKDRPLLRPYLEIITDHWGFDNGQEYGMYFAPSVRVPNTARAQNGILTSIHYPTGGVTTFEYASHDYAKMVDSKDRTLVSSSLGTGGGVRIRKITSDDGTGGGFSKEYFYSTSPTETISSGVLNAMPTYRFKMDVTDRGGNRLYIYNTQNTPVIPLTIWNDGISVAYTDVCVKQSGKGIDNGYTHYTFTNHDNGYADVMLTEGQYNRAPYVTNPANSRAFERGKLLREEQYNAAGKLVYKKEKSWDRYGSQGEDNVRAIFVQNHDVGNGYFSLACYLNYVYKFLPAKQVETVFDSNGANPVAKTITYTYNEQMLLATEETTTSRGTYKETYKYPFDLPTIVSHQKMVKKHILSPIVEKTQYQDNNYLQSESTLYKQWTSTISDSESTQKQTYFAPEFIQTKQTYLQIIPETRFQYLSYDAYANPVAVSINGGAENVVYLWSYGGQYLVAEIRNATLSEVNAVLSTVFDVESVDELATMATPDETALKDGSLQRALPHSQVTSYTHKPLIGVTSSTDPTGLTTTYEYDTFGRLAKINDPDGHVIESYEYNYAH